MASTRPLPSPPLRAQAGLVRRLLRDPQPVLDELTAAHGPIVGLGAGPARIAIVGEPTALRELFGSSTDSFRWGHRYNSLGFVVGPGSMIVSDGADHARRRGAVRSAFSRRRLNGWIPTILDRTDAAIDRVTADIATPDDLVDLYPVGRALVLDIVVRALFGEAMAARADEIGARFERPQAYLESPALRQLPHPFPHTRRSRVRDDRRALDELIDERIAWCRSEPSGDPLDVLEALVSEGSLTDPEIRDQVVTLVGAGYDTTSASLAWMLWCAALTPGLWDRLRAEADEVFGPPDAPGPSTTADAGTLSRLQLADRVNRETTRLHPAGALSPRQATVDLDIGGFRIRSGTLVLWSAYLAGRDPAAWDDPLRFDPDRFVDPSPERRALADLAWVPFGRGSRNCIGFALAQMELTLILARLAQRLDVAATASTAPRAVGMVVNRPVGGAPMRVAVRWD